MQKQFDEFKNIYSLAKTLRFSLIPQGKTLENINKNGLLEEDEQRAQNYQKMKSTINAYHRLFIEKALSNVKFDNEILSKYKQLYIKKNSLDKTEIKEFEEVCKKLRKDVNKSYTDNGLSDIFNKIGKKELISDLIPNTIQKNELISLNNEEIYFTADFNKFTTYFKGFNQNLQNIYGSDGKVVEIAFRIIDENLPKFINNIKTYNKIKSNLDSELKELKFQLEQENISKSEIIFDEIFCLENYEQFVSQSKIDIYNTIISGLKKPDGTQIKGINNIVNEYTQKNGGINLPVMEILYKQILSESNSYSFIIENFENTNQVVEGIQQYYADLMDSKCFENLKNLIENMVNNQYNLNNIFVKNQKGNIELISQKIFSDYKVINNAIKGQYIKENNINDKKINKTQQAKIERYLKSDYFSLGYLQQSLNEYMQLNSNEYENYSQTCILDYFKNNFFMEVNKQQNETRKIDFIESIKNAYSEFIKCLEDGFEQNKFSQEQTNAIKCLLDEIMSLLKFISILKVDSYDVDTQFYDNYNKILEKLKYILNLHTKTRNFVSKKPYNLDKFKLNFKKSTLAAGWDSNSEKDYLALMFVEELPDNKRKYYLGVMNTNNKPVFKDETFTGCNEDCLSKMDYKLLPIPEQNFPRVFFAKKNIEKFNPSEKIISGYRLGKHKKGNDFDKDFMHDLIDFFKQSINKNQDWKDFDFKFSDTKTYEDISGFYREVVNQGYKLTLKKFPKEYINAMVDENKLYLFQIYNKDFSEYSKGNKNLHTMYFESLFSEENLKDVVYKLNGGAELFYRPKSLNYDKATHPSGQEIEHKKDGKEANNKYSVYQYNCDNGEQKFLFDLDNNIDLDLNVNEYIKNKYVSENQINYKSKICVYIVDSKGQIVKNKNGNKMVFSIIKNKNPNNKNKYSCFYYDLIKDKRFTNDQFSLHLSITMNFKSLGKNNINKQACEYLKNNKDVNIIGIDRGEKELIYISLINQNGQVLKDDEGNYIQYSLNELSNNFENPVNYKSLLEQKEEERKKAKQDWKSVSNIKELKEGYISKIINQIVKIMVKHNAIIVMEDLNFGFKRSRIKIDKSIYQKFETKLINKLEYLVLKNNDFNENAGLYNALQLSSKFDTFKKLSKQSGFIFYVNPSNTSKIDPVTGFVNLLYPKYENIEKAKEFFGCFDAIKYNLDKKYFEFKINYANFNNKDCYQKKWTICTHQPENSTRYYYGFEQANDIKKDYHSINVNEQMEKLFKENQIEFGDGKDLIKNIIEMENKEFFKRLIFLLKTTLNIRYSDGKNVDVIISPVADENGIFFNSDDYIICKDNQKENKKLSKGLPQDADANGAYNIARKGIMVLNKINNLEDLSKKVDFKIPNSEWFEFAQKNNGIDN